MTSNEMDDAPLRPTGRMERFNIIRNHLKFYNKLGVVANYTAPLLTATLQATIFTCLKEVLNHHPILGVTTLNEGSPEPTWTRLKSFDLRSVVKFVQPDVRGNDGWIQDALRAPFEVVEDLPLWRVVIVPQEAEGNDKTSFAVGFFCHHAIADGVSAGAFQLTFLDALNDLIDGKIGIEQTAVVQVPKLPLVPNIEMATPLPVGILYALKKVMNTYVYSSEDPRVWTGARISAESPRPAICNLK
ncbi:Uncharacterized protein LSUE1_G004256 [Lachnellula suecica]|uniref:Alcohol acetyltransferase FCK4 n=1 Tax=Lachnellula suecica TaxID=602035 RepID=A0A8T9CC83_9HELO|nr:Uncharacterized protein LSUE1_G004256 [Lachnellula suecica]